MADVKTKYGAWTTIGTYTVEGLATSSTFTVGRESPTLLNTSNLYVDVLLAGKITTGTTTTVNTNILLYVYGVMDDTPTYPTPFTGADAGLTVTSAAQASGFLKLGAVLTTHTSAETSVAHEFGPFSVGQLFGGILPTRIGLFVTHNTGVNLHATTGNHVFKYMPITYTVA